MVKYGGVPTWIPGSYLIRDFAKNICNMHASCNGMALQITQLDNSRWQTYPCNGPLKIEYRLLFNDLSPRGAYIDQYYVLLEPVQTFIQIENQLEKK